MLYSYYILMILLLLLVLIMPILVDMDYIFKMLSREKIQEIVQQN